MRKAITNTLLLAGFLSMSQTGALFGWGKKKEAAAPASTAPGTASTAGSGTASTGKPTTSASTAVVPTQPVKK